MTCTHYNFPVPEEKMVRVITDTDLCNEADDPFAVVQALLSPKFDNVGVVAAHFGTRDPNGMQKSWQGLKDLTVLMQLTVPVLLCFCFSRCPAERLICPSKTREIKEKNKRFHRLKFFSFSFCRYSCCFPKSLPSLPGRAGQGIDGLVSSRKSKSSPGTFPNYCK